MAIPTPIAQRASCENALREPPTQALFIPRRCPKGMGTCERSSDWRRGAAGPPTRVSNRARNLAVSPDPYELKLRIILCVFA